MVAKTETFQDNFDDNSIDPTKWNNLDGSQIVETNYELEITNTLSTTFYEIQSVNQYDLTSSYVFVKLVVDNPALLYNDPSFLVFIDGDNYLVFLIESNVLYAQYYSGGTQHPVSNVAYNATNHKWLRMRESGGTTYWDTSPDGLTWTNFTSAGNPIVLTSVYISLGSGTYSVSGVTTARFDNLNTLGSAICAWIGQ
jgi:hypothetical protein